MIPFHCSVIIPTCQKLDAVFKTVESLSKLTFPPDEVLVVQNGLPEPEHELEANRYADFVSTFPRLKVKCFHDPVPGLLAGRHRGFMESMGEVLIYLDDDVSVVPDWLTSITGPFEADQVVLVGGPSRPLFAVEPPSWVNDLWHATPDGGRIMAQLSLQELNTPDPCAVDPGAIWGLNYAIRRSTLVEMGGFHPDNVPRAYQHFQGDGETGLSTKIANSGYRAVYHPAAAINHHIPAERLTLQYMQNRHFYQGVANSYTYLRSGNSVLPETKSNLQVLSKIRHAIGQLKRLAFTDTTSPVRDQLDRSYQFGFQFHQDCVRRSPSLLEWVRRETYFDYRYPALESDFTHERRTG